jgi:hypothetical protein
MRHASRIQTEVVCDLASRRGFPMMENSHKPLSVLFFLLNVGKNRVWEESISCGEVNQSKTKERESCMITKAMGHFLSHWVLRKPWLPQQTNSSQPSGACADVEAEQVGVGSLVLRRRERQKERLRHLVAQKTRLLSSAMAENGWSWSSLFKRKPLIQFNCHSPGN